MGVLSGGYTITISANELEGEVKQVGNMVILPMAGQAQVQMDINTALCVEAALVEARRKQDKARGISQLKYWPITAREKL